MRYFFIILPDSSSQRTWNYFIVLGLLGIIMHAMCINLNSVDPKITQGRVPFRAPRLCTWPLVGNEIYDENAMVDAARGQADC